MRDLLNFGARREEGGMSNQEILKHAQECIDTQIKLILIVTF